MYTAYIESQLDLIRPFLLMALCSMNADWLSLSLGFMEMKVILIKVTVEYGWLSTHTLCSHQKCVSTRKKEPLEFDMNWS